MLECKYASGTYYLRYRQVRNLSMLEGKYDRYDAVLHIVDVLEIYPC